MKRGWAVCPAGNWNPATAVDRVLLDSAARHGNRIAMIGENGTAILLDLDEPLALHDGDGIVLDDGSVVMVSGAPEPLLELSAHSPLETVRLAWHLGNRHVDVQIAGGRLRIRDAHGVEEMAAGLGVTVTRIQALFDPGSAAPSHDHGHHHGPGEHHHHHHD